MRRHIYGLLEAHTIASFIAMTFVAFAFGAEQSASPNWNPILSATAAPVTLPMFVLPPMRYERGYMTVARHYAMVIYFIGVIVFAAMRWNHWTQPMVIAKYERGRRARLRRIIGRGTLLVLVLGCCVVATLLATIDVGLERSGYRDWLGVASVAITFGGPPALLCWAIYHQITKSERVKESTLCRMCSYDLTGNVSGVCPECGCAVQVKQG